ncbi:hypothetical protein RRG08_044058 [Elysia crispata]|uniref:Uncharacterized protein n=1 Tax=Elysia crispata TaxID=231223 RepID=A0AAE0Y1Z7_9GAST|nr:hypothetical protein RRG08_044058 [Elysia crispata]
MWTGLFHTAPGRVALSHWLRPGKDHPSPNGTEREAMQLGTENLALLRVTWMNTDTYSPHQQHSDHYALVFIRSDIPLPPIVYLPSPNPPILTPLSWRLSD